MPHKYTSDEKSFPKCDFLTRILVSDFLENDVGLWDAFFTKTSSKHQSVLRPAALPVDEYLQDHLRRGGEHQVRLLDIISTLDIYLLSTLYLQVRDLSSLRVLLPSSQKHLAAPPRSRDTRDSSSPIRQVGTIAMALSSLAPPVDNVDIASATPSLM